MHLNEKVLDQIKWSDSKILAVTKYHTADQTHEIIDELWEKYPDILEWFGENRVEQLKEKDIPREYCHFIWNIQTKQIKTITEYCSVIHSVDNIKHIKKLEEICAKQWNWIEIYLQVNLDSSKPGWVSTGEIPALLEFIWDLENVSLIWFSWIGKLDCSIEEKKEEFQILLDLRNKYLQNGFVSAGTSSDYEIALEMWVDIVRVWKALIV